MTNQQELMLKLSVYEQQIRQIQEQIQAINEAVVETSRINEDLNDLKGSEGNEVMAAIGKGIFIKAKIISEDLIVDVGGKNFVKKSVGETQKTISRQIQKLGEIKEELEAKLDEIGEELTKTISEARED